MSYTLFTFQYKFIILIYLLTTIHMSTGGNNGNYTTCKTDLFYCGSITNLGYPFWGGNRPEFCGGRSFGLTCQTDKAIGVPVINRMGTTNGAESFNPIVVNINTSSNTLSLVQNLFTQDSNISCQNLVRNETIISLSEPFKFTPLVANISLFFDCITSAANNYSGSLKFVTCYDVNTIPTNLAYYVDNPKDAGNINKLCSSRRVFPVLKSELDDLNKGIANLSRVLNKGFEVEYTVEGYDACSVCQNSGGVCGSSGDNKMIFSCYCQDGAHTKLCPQPKLARVSGKKPLKYVGSVSGCLLALIILVSVSLILCYKKQLFLKKFPSLEIRGTKEDQNVEAFLKAYGSIAPKRYRYSDIKKIASSFKEKLGEGGFGCVYKGKLKDGRLVAVKLLNKMKGNGEDIINEVLSISRTNHVNVVTLLGFCLEGNKRALIYEYMVNGSLDKYISCHDTHPSLQWETLLKIAIGIARGLNYLHRGCNARILHFDIKPHNVLLDEEFWPKISDFGLAKLCPTRDSTTISMLEARGTIGYIAPEVVYRNIGGVSHKSDVYSYGMMVLNMACRRSNLPDQVQRSSEQYFPEWIFNQLEQTEVATDKTTLNEENEKEVQRKMILVSLWCIQKYPSERPSMDRVLEMIEGPLESVPMPPRAATVYI